MARLLIAVSVTVGCSVQHPEAQEPLGWSGEVSQEECERAQLALESSTAERDRLLAMQELSRCGPRGGQLIAGELGTLRDISDPEALRRLVPQFLFVRDASILKAATELAADQSASREARIGSIMIVVTQAHPSFRTSYQDYLPYDGVEIPGASVGPPIPHQGRTFAVDWKERTDSILSAVMEDPGESEEMRWASNRGLLYLRSLGDGSGWD